MKILQELIQFPCRRNLKGLNTQSLGRQYYCYDEIDSTQKEIWRRADNNEIIDGVLVKAEKQTSGVGTHGRTWYTDRNNIAFSFYMELNCKISKIEGITIDIARTIVDVIKKMYNVQLEIKVPNDLYVKGKKLGGILTETKLKGNIAKFLIVGIGMNNSQIEFCDEIENIATSFKKEFSIEVDVEEFITNFCNSFEMMVRKRVVT